MRAWILYENEDWLPPLFAALESGSVPFERVLVDGGALCTAHLPETGVYVNRMSPSSHTRGHHGAVQFMREYLAYLEAQVASCGQLQLVAASYSQVVASCSRPRGSGS